MEFPDNSKLQKNYSSLHGKNDPYGSKKRLKRCKQKVEPEQSKNYDFVTHSIGRNVAITLLDSFAHPRQLKVVIGNVLDL